MIELWTEAFISPPFSPSPSLTRFHASFKAKQSPKFVERTEENVIKARAEMLRCEGSCAIFRTGDARLIDQVTRHQLQTVAKDKRCCLFKSRYRYYTSLLAYKNWTTTFLPVRDYCSAFLAFWFPTACPIAPLRFSNNVPPPPPPPFFLSENFKT